MTWYNLLNEVTEAFNLQFFLVPSWFLQLLQWLKKQHPVVKSNLKFDMTLLNCVYSYLRVHLVIHAWRISAPDVWRFCGLKDLTLHGKLLSQKIKTKWTHCTILECTSLEQNNAESLHSSPARSVPLWDCDKTYQDTLEDNKSKFWLFSEEDMWVLNSGEKSQEDWVLRLTFPASVHHLNWPCLQVSNRLV